MKYLIFIFFAITLQVFAQLPQYNVTMTPGDYSLLYTRDIFSDSLIPATFESNGSYWNDAQIRFKGHSTRYYPKKSYRVKFAKSHLFQSMRQINFNAMYTDKSAIREKLVWDLFSELGQLAPHAFHTRYTMNGESKGLYLFIEKIDDYLLKNRGRKVAPLYEASDTYIGADLTVQPDSILKIFYDKTIGSATDYSDLTQLIAAINSAPDASFSDTLQKYFDVNSILNWFTGNILTMMGDSYNKNYLLYHDTSKTVGQWVVIPWDYDLSFGRSGDLGIPYPASLLNDGFAYTFPPMSGPSNVLKDRFMATPSLWEELRLHVDSSLQTIFTENHLYPRIDSLAALVEHDEAIDPYKWGTINDFRDHVEALKYFVTARRNYLLKTFINPPSGQYNIVTLPVSQTDTAYNFVAFDGRQIATLWFKNIQGLDSIRVRVYPDSTPPGVPNTADQKFVRRWAVITPYPSGAKFTAKLQWMYSDVSSLDREVGAGVQDERLLRMYLSDGNTWTPLPSKINFFANIATIDSITQDECGNGKLFALLLPDSYTQKWYRQPLNYWQRWYDVKFSDSLTGFVVGEHGTVIKTTDAGGTWQESYVGLSLPLKSVTMPSLNNIIVAGANGSLYSSKDTGRSWTRLNLGTAKNINRIFFDSAQVGWIFGEKGLLMRSTNGGIDWVTWTVDSAKNIIGMIKHGSNSNTVYFDDGSYLTTSDSGSTWTSGTIGTKRKLTNAIILGNQHWIVGDSGLVLFSPTGSTYNDISIPTTDKIHDLFVINPTTLYAACDGGKIFYTTNNGVNWYSQYTADSHDFYAITFTDSSHGFAVGNSGSVLKTISTGTVTQVKDIASKMPEEFRIYPNYPNPFNPTTTIRYDLPSTSRVKLRIYNILGQVIATLVDEVQTSGYKSVTWRADNSPSGIYFYSIIADGMNGKILYDVRKMILIR